MLICTGTSGQPITNSAFLPSVICSSLDLDNPDSIQISSVELNRLFHAAGLLLSIPSDGSAFHAAHALLTGNLLQGGRETVPEEKAVFQKLASAKGELYGFINLNGADDPAGRA